MPLVTHGHKSSDRQIKRKAAHGLVWTFMTYGVSKSVTLLTIAILARYLAKTDFGLMAVAVMALNYLSVFKDLGLGMALIQSRLEIETAANTVFTLNLIAGVLLSAVMYPIAPYVSAYFQDMSLTPLLRYLGLSFIINALGSVHLVRLQRDLKFRRKFIPETAGAVVKGVVAICLAIGGAGVWSLVLGQLAGAFAIAVAVWIVFPWRPKIEINWTATRSLLKFGTSMVGVEVLSAFTDNLPTIIVGKVCGLALLGVFSLAYRLPEMMIIANLWVMGGVFYPTFAALQTRLPELRTGFLASIRLVGMIIMPLSLLLVIASEPIVLGFFGDEWSGAIPVLRILAVYALFYSIGFHVGGVYKAMGRPDILLKLSLMTFVLMVVALLIGARHGLVGVATGYLVTIVIRRAVSLTVANHVIDVSFSEIFSELKPALTGGCILALIALPVLFLTGELHPLLSLSIVSTLALAAYVSTVLYLEKDRLIGIIGLFSKDK